MSLKFLDTTEVLTRAHVSGQYDVEEAWVESLHYQDIQHLEVEGEGLFLMTDWALSQLATKLGIPGKYALHCIAESAGELKAQFDSWIRHKSEGAKDWRVYLRIRLLKGEKIDGVIRGVMFPTFTKLDDAEVLEVIVSSLRDAHMRFSLATPEHGPNPKDPENPESCYDLVIDDPIPLPPHEHGGHIYIGLHILNSAVGKMALSIRISLQDDKGTMLFFDRPCRGPLAHYWHKDVEEDAAIDHIHAQVLEWKRKKSDIRKTVLANTSLYSDTTDVRARLIRGGIGPEVSRQIISHNPYLSSGTPLGLAFAVAHYAKGAQSSARALMYQGVAGKLLL